MTERDFKNGKKERSRQKGKEREEVWEEERREETKEGIGRKRKRGGKRYHRMMSSGVFCPDLVINLQFSGTYNPGTSKSERFQIWVILDHFSAALPSCSFLGLFVYFFMLLILSLTMNSTIVGRNNASCLRTESSLSAFLCSLVGCCANMSLFTW